MTHLFLTADPFGLATQGVAGYLFYVRALCLAIAAVICIVGTLSVYSAYVDGDSDVRMKTMRLVFSCVFMVTASFALPAFFGMDATQADISYSGGGSGITDIEALGSRPPGLDIQGLTPHIVLLPGGGSAVIWHSIDRS